MAANLTNYAENALLDHLLGGTAFTMPTNTYLKLHVGDPGEDGTANPAGETLRKVMSWGAASARAIETDTQIDWLGVSTAETVSHFSIHDAVTAGNPLAYGPLAVPQALLVGDDLAIPVGGIDLDFLTGMLTTATANSALDHLVGRAAWTQPAGHFVKLHLGAPGVDATANPAAETTRANAGAFSAAAAGASDNDAVISWSSVSTTETVTHISGWDTVGPAGGIALYQGALDAGIALTAGQNAEFAAGALDLDLL